MVEDDDVIEGELSLLCLAASLACSLPVAHVIEIMRPLPVEPFAGAPRCVSGVALIRAEVLPVVDLGELLGTRQTKVTRFVTLNLGVRRAALAVEQVVGVRKLPAAMRADLPPLLSTTDTELIAALGRLDTQIVRTLSAMHLLPQPALAELDAVLPPGAGAPR